MMTGIFVNKNLEEIISEALLRNIPIELKNIGGVPSFVIHIGSKTGTGDLYFDEDGDLRLRTRYQSPDEADCVYGFRDVAAIAFDWYLRYKDREPFGEPSIFWVKAWEEFGWLKATKVTTTKYEICQ